jgi:MFS transporter, DHA2 family, multidrug resistance protein
MPTLPPAAVGCTGILLGALDFGFMTLAGPAIDRELGLGAAYPWLFSASSFGYGATLVPAGWAVERIGASAVVRAGSALYVCALVLTALAPSVSVLLAGRTLLGIGGGVIAPAALALLAGVDAKAGSAPAFAGAGGAVATGFVGGVLLASLAIEADGWRAVLIGLAAAVLALRLLSRPASVTRRRAAQPAGMLAIGAGVPVVAAAIGFADDVPVASAASVALVGVAITWALRREPGAGRAALAPDARLAAVCAAGAATTASGVGGIALLGRALPGAGGLSAPATGLLLAAFGLAVPLAVVAARWLSGAVGAGSCCGAGLAGQAVALCALGLIPLAAHAAVAAIVALFGAGHVLANAGATEAAMRGAARNAGPRAALLAVAQYLGAGAGAVAVLTAAGSADPAAGGVRAGLLLAAAIAVSGAMVTRCVTV